MAVRKSRRNFTSFYVIMCAGEYLHPVKKLKVLYQLYLQLNLIPTESAIFQ